MTEARPWHALYPSDVPQSLEPYPDESVYALLQGAAAGFPKAPALTFFGRHISYGELLVEVERCSAVLAGLGVGKGDRVGLLLPNCPEYVITWFACQRLGAVAVGNNPLYTERELEHQIKDSGARVMVVLDQVYTRFGHVRDATDIDEVIVVQLNHYMPWPIRWLAPIKFKADAKEHGTPLPFVPTDHTVRSWKELMAHAGPVPPEAVIDDPAATVAALVYTGGTTGLSKGAMLSHRNLVANARQAAAWFPVVRRGEDGVLASLPFFHAFGMLAMNFAITKAAKLVLIPRFDIDMVLKAIAKEKPTLFPGVPRMYIALNEYPKTKKYDLHALKACVSGAAPLPMAVAQEFERVSGGAKVVEGYGLSECSPVTHANPLVGERREGAIGLPLPDTDVKLIDLDDPDREVPHRRARRAVHQGAAGHARLLAQARGDRADDPQRMAAHGRRRRDGPRRLLPHRRPHQGHGPGVGLQRVSHGDRGRALSAPEDLQVRRDRRARRRHRRAREGLHRAEGGRVGDARGDHGVVPRPGAGPHRLPRPQGHRVPRLAPRNAHRQGPASRAAGRRAHAPATPPPAT